MSRRERPKSRHAERPGRARAPAAVGALVLFVLLQCLAAAAASLRISHSREGVVSSLPDATCARHAPDVGGAPAPHCDHAQCCILCGAQAAFFPAPAAAEHIRRAAHPGSPARARRMSGGVPGQDGRPPGWASSWSSQAPPVFS